VKLNRSHVVPTLVHDGTILVESTLSNEYLDDAFPECPLRSADHLAMTPFLSRAVRPRPAGWYDRCRARPSFETAVAKWAPEVAVDMLRANGAAVWPEVEALHAACGSNATTAGRRRESRRAGGRGLHGMVLAYFFVNVRVATGGFLPATTKCASSSTMVGFFGSSFMSGAS
jgi:hypothetical protein